MLRFFLHAVPLIVALLALFSVTVGFFDAGPVGALTLLDPVRVPFDLVLGTWLLEAFGLVALYLLIEGRMGHPWLDGLIAGWVAWIFRGPLLVVTIVVAAGKPQAPWFRLALGWWILYSVCGLMLALLAGFQKKRTAETEPADEPDLYEPAGDYQARAAEPESDEPESDEPESDEPGRRPAAVEER